MSSQYREALKILNLHLNIEKNETKRYGNKINSTNSTLLKLIYTQIQQDSARHAENIKAIIDLLRFGGWGEKQRINESKEDLKNCIGIEINAKNFAYDVIEKINDPGIKLLLRTIALDEEKHFILLNYILENTSKK